MIDRTCLVQAPTAQSRLRKKFAYIIVNCLLVLTEFAVLGVLFLGSIKQKKNFEAAIRLYKGGGCKDSLGMFAIHSLRDKIALDRRDWLQD
jgi:hypothetical protein